MFTTNKGHTYCLENFGFLLHETLREDEAIGESGVRAESESYTGSHDEIIYDIIIIF